MGKAVVNFKILKILEIDYTRRKTI